MRAVYFVMLLAWSACAGDKDHEGHDEGPNCTAISDACHEPGESGDAEAEACHDIAHDADEAVCEAELDRCVTYCEGLSDTGA